MPPSLYGALSQQHNREGTGKTHLQDLSSRMLKLVVYMWNSEQDISNLGSQLQGSTSGLHGTQGKQPAATY